MPALAEGRAEGLLEGRVEGLVKGQAEGETKKQAEIVCRMLDMKMPLADIASATGLSKADVERLAAEQKAE